MAVDRSPEDILDFILARNPRELAACRAHFSKDARKAQLASARANKLQMLAQNRARATAEIAEILAEDPNTTNDEIIDLLIDEKIYPPHADLWSVRKVKRLRKAAGL